MTEVCDRTLRASGPALLFEKPTGFDMPVLGNLFGTPERVALGMGAEDVGALREIGKLLAQLKEPEPPKGPRDAWAKLPMRTGRSCPWRRRCLAMPLPGRVEEGEDVDLGRLPVQTCWPGDVGPLITWGLTVTRGPNKERQNLHLPPAGDRPQHRIMRWLSHRGGALDYREWCQKHPPALSVAVALGADPATILGAVTVPDTLSGIRFRRPVARASYRAGQASR